jgi:hypothetical protein
MNCLPLVAWRGWLAKIPRVVGHPGAGMKELKYFRQACAASALLLFGAAQAHHSSAMFDDKKSITIEGPVSKFEWSNPHVYIYVKQMTNGQLLEWE